MTSNTNTALVERDGGSVDLQVLAGEEIKTPQAYADRIRAMQGHAHILSPMAAVASIAPSHVISTMVVVIDPSVDASTGRGGEVYHQRTMHKGTGRGDNYRPIEVSLSKNGLLKMLSAAGVNVYPTERLDDGQMRNLWIMRTQGDIMDFDGRYRRLPPGTASVDLQDGSADIGEWTPEKWAEAVRIAEAQKAKTPPADQWKVKASVNGWSYDRVLQARKFGLRLAEAKSLNALARNLGVRQVYTIEELQKPFVIFRASFIPDTSDPEIRRMLTAASLGARALMYPSAAPEQVPLAGTHAPVTHGHGDPAQQIEGEVVQAHEHEPDVQTAQAPDDAEEFTLDAPAPRAAEPTFVVTKVLRQGKGAEARYFVETRQGKTFYTADADVARACAAAAKDTAPRQIVSQAVSVGGKTYLEIVEVAAADGLKY